MQNKKTVENQSPTVPKIDVSVFSLSNVQIDTSKINKIDCNQKSSSAEESVDKLLDASNATWSVTFKPKDTTVKVTFKEAVELVGYKFVLSDKSERDPLDWRVKTKEEKSLNFSEESFKLPDTRKQENDFKIKDGLKKKIIEVQFTFDKIRSGNIIALRQIKFLAPPANVMSSVSSQAQVNINTYQTEVTEPGKNFTIHQTSVKYERSKSDSGSEGTKRERLDRHSFQMFDHIDRKSMKLDDMDRADIYKEWKRFSVLGNQNWRNSYLTNATKFGTGSTIVRVGGSNGDNVSMNEEIRRTTHVLDAGRNSLANTQVFTSSIRNSVERDNLYKDFKHEPEFQSIRKSIVVTDTHNESFQNMKQQNDAMIQKLSISNSPESTQYQKYLEQEKWHNMNIQKITKQHSDFNFRLSEQVTRIQNEKNEMEQKYKSEINELQRKYMQLEMKYTVDVKRLEQENTVLISKRETYLNEIKSLQSYINEHEKMHQVKVHELNSTKMASTEVEMKYMSQIQQLESICKDHEIKYSMKSEECKSLHLKIQEIEKTLQQRIEILYKEKSETEKKYFLKVEEANKIHTQLKDLEVNFNVKLESVHTQVSNERIMEIEKKYNYQIDQLYQTMADMEKKHRHEMQSHNEKFHEVEKKYTQQIHISQKQDAVQMSKLTEDIALLMEANANYEAKIDMMIREHQSKMAEVETRYKSEIHILNQKSIELETKHAHQIQVVQRTQNTEQYTLEISRLQTQISEMEKMHKSQVESLYLRLSEREKQYHLSIEQYKSQLSYLEKKQSEDLVEMKKIYESESQKRMSIQSIDLKNAMSIEIKSKYEAELLQLQKMNQELVRKHVKQVETLYQEKTDLELKHSQETKQLKDQVGYLEGKYSTLKHFEEKMAHYQIPETKIIYKYDEGLVTQNAYYEKRHEELMSQIMQMKEENSSLLTQVAHYQSSSESVKDKCHIQIESLKVELEEKERRFTIQMESMHQEKLAIERQRQEKNEYINSLLAQIQTLEKTHQEYCLKLQTEFREKESTYMSRISEIQLKAEQSSSIEMRYTAQIERLNQEFQITERTYAEQIQTLQEQHAEMEASLSKKIEIHYSKAADLEKMYTFEMKKMEATQREMTTKMESQIQSLLSEKIIHETQKAHFSSEMKKLFAINAELEKKLANKELEYHAVCEHKTHIHKSETSKVEMMTSKMQEFESQHVEKIEEIKKLQAKVTETERQYASQIEALYVKIAEQESRYKAKVEEINVLQQQNSNLLIQTAQSSQAAYMKSSMSASYEEKTMAEISQFKEVNAELERKFLLRIQEYQSQVHVYESREIEFNAKIQSLNQVITEHQLKIQSLQEELFEVNAVKEKWEIFKSSHESKYESKVAQLESYHAKQMETIKAQYEVRMTELKTIKESGTEKEKQLSIQVKSLQQQNASFENRQSEYMEQIRIMQEKYAELQKTHNQATQKYYAKLSEQERMSSSKVQDYTAIIEQLKVLQISKNELEMKHASQMEDLLSHNAHLESKVTEHLEEMQKLQKKIIEVQKQYAEFKETVYKESHSASQSVSVNVEEVKKIEFEMKESAIHMQKIEVEKQMIKKDHEIREIRESIEILKKEHHIEIEELRKKNAEYVERYNNLRVEKFSEFEKSILIEDKSVANVDAKYKIEILQKQIEEMKKLSKYQFSSTETTQKYQSQIMFLEMKCKTYLEEIKALKNQQNSVTSYSFELENKMLRDEINSLRDQLLNNSRIVVDQETSYLRNEVQELRDKLISQKMNETRYSANFTVENDSRVMYLQEENQRLTEKLQEAQSRIISLNLEIERNMIEIDGLNQTIKSMQQAEDGFDTYTMKSLKEKNQMLEERMNKLDKLQAMNNEIKVRRERKEEEKITFDETISGKNIQDKNQNNMFHHEAFQAKKGYDTSSMVKFATSIPNIPELIKKSEADLKKLSLSKIEWSTVSNKQQPPALQSIKFYFNDGSCSAEWGQRDQSTLQTFEFKDQKVASIGFDNGNFYVLQMTFYDENKKVIVKCGNVGEDSKIKSVEDKIIYVYGANSMDGKCVGMIGFTFYKPQVQIKKEQKIAIIETIDLDVSNYASKTSTARNKKESSSPVKRDIDSKKEPRKTEALAKIRKIAVINTSKK